MNNLFYFFLNAKQVVFYIPIAYLIYFIGIDIYDYITTLLPIVAAQEKMVAYSDSILNTPINLFSIGYLMKISIY
ncbi:hypothetical protein EZS27_013662 [termite gut metagenome]|uniref:Uncharacterized protein n=1 Tax=termite gut metagenome TaxID=433724 RepID=A0A5J4RYN3_9ZZZZ